MPSMRNSAVMITMIAIIIASLLAVESAYSAPTVSAPEFIVQLIANPYDVPTTYSTDKFTGENITHPGYPVENKTIAIIIKNQHFMSSLNGETYRLFYNVRTRGHFETTWIETIPNETRPIEAFTDHFVYGQFVSENSYPASDSENTTLFYNIQDYFYGQIDFQVRTILGRGSEVFVSEYMENKPAYIGHMEPAIAFDAMSGWSGTQTATIPDATTETSPTPSSTSPIPNESVSPSQSPTASPMQPNTQTENPLGLDWEIIAFVILFFVVAVLVVVVAFQQRRLSGVGLKLANSE
jgi:hypothetical protein